MEIAFYGTGLMGAPMATRIAAAGLPVRAWNRSIAKAEALNASSITAFKSAREALSGAQIACFCLTDGAAIDDLLFGAERLADAFAADQLVINFSTCGVAADRRFAGLLPARWLDCPVSGGVAGAERGSLIAFAGGDAADFERAAPVLDAVAARSMHMGDVGAGQATKLCNQLIVSANLAAIAEAIALGEALGVNTAVLPAALQGGFADSQPLQLFGGRMAAETDPGPRVGAIATMIKDVGLCRQAAQDLGVDLPLIDAVSAVYQRAVALGLANEDLPALMAQYRGKT